MADPEATTKAFIHYYCREGYYRSMQNESRKGVKDYNGHPVYKLYYGISLVLEGQLQEGMRELDIIKDDPEVTLGAMLALIHAHRQCRMIDKEAITKLDAKFKEERKRAGDKALYYAGLFLFMTRRHDKAREYVDRVLKISPSSRQGSSLKGWLEMVNIKDSNQSGKDKNILDYFDVILTSGKDIDALLGKAKFFESRKNFNGSLDFLNQIIVTWPTFLPGLIEKMKIQLAMHDWEQVQDSANRILSTNSHCIEAKKYKILYDICIAGDYKGASVELGMFLEDLKKSEPKNAELYSNSAKLFSRVCGRRMDILKHTLIMVEQAVTLNDNVADYLGELGHQNILQGNTKEALKHFKNATKVDESSVAALTGIITCQIIDGHLDVAEQQLEFLKEIQKSIGVSPELLYLSSHLELKRGRSNPVNILDNLNECVDTHFKNLRDEALGSHYYILLNPDFLLLVLGEYLRLCPTQPINAGQSVPQALNRCLTILEPITKTCPGLTEAAYLSAKVKYLLGETRGASNILQHILDQLDATHVESQLLIAQIYLHEGKVQQAQQSLEQAVSYKFDIRDNPVYHMINAKIEKSQGKLEEASKSLLTAMRLAGIKPSSGQVKKQTKTEMSDKDTVSLYLNLSEVYCLQNKQHEATKIMQDAIMAFKGTPEEVCVSIANAELMLNYGDIEHSLSILRSIGPEQSYYPQARERMAHIYLHHRQDKRMFANCFREIVEKTGSLESQLMLGDAYMNIQEPELAIEVYEQAMKRNPRNTTLARKIGNALVKTHNYNKAIIYYKEAIKNENQSFLRYDLAELLMKLKHYDKAERVVMQALENDLRSKNGNNYFKEPVTDTLSFKFKFKCFSQGFSQTKHCMRHVSSLADQKYTVDLTALMFEAKMYLLLANIYRSSDNNQGAVSSLTKAKDIQSKILKTVQVEQPNILAQQKELTASICCQMAENCVNQRDFEKSVRLYKEALIYNERDSKALLDLAKLYMTLGDLDSCQSTCSKLLRTDQENDSATVMMADLMFRKNDYESAIYHFKQLLDRKPGNYEALGRVIEVMRRIGKLDEIPSYLEKAETASSRAAQHAGLSFCKGLYEWYTGNTNAAINNFNKARRSDEWGQKSIYNMIEICLNPDNDTLGGEVFEEVDLGNSQYDKQDFQDVAIRTASKLIRELKPMANDIHRLVLTNFLLLATRQKSNAEKSLNDFMQMASTPLYRDHIGIIFGIATSYMILKQTQRARNQLKRISKNNWSFEDAEYLERCWLLLADIYIQSGKYDMASELLKKVLEHNKSCCKAYEYMGLITEKEQSYKDAATNYEQAWKYSNHNNPVIGYKLAFNYMKAKRYVDAIDICHSILSKYPNYPKVKKEILEKSRSNLRI